jgi:subtilase family serine protease
LLFFLAALASIAFVIFYFLNGTRVPFIPGDNNPFLVPKHPPSFPNNNIKSLPDLSVKWVERPSGKFSCETPFPIAASVSNRGQATAYNIEVIHNGIRTAQYIYELKPNHSKKLRFYPKLPNTSPGYGAKKFHFHFAVDPHNRVRETNEQNNRSESFYVECF